MDWPPGLSGRDALAPSSPYGVASRRTLRAERRFATLPGLGPQKGQQVGVELLLVCAHEAVGRARIDLQGRVLDDLPSPWMIRVGMSNFLRSSVMSVSEKALMQSSAPLRPTCIDHSQNASRRPYVQPRSARRMSSNLCERDRARELHFVLSIFACPTAVPDIFLLALQWCTSSLAGEHEEKRGKIHKIFSSCDTDASFI